MEINKHICFCDEEVPRLIHYLNRHNIPYSREEHLSSLDIYESCPHWNHIKKHVTHNDLLCISETVFSEQELQDAEWLEVRSQWRYDYPQPESGYKTVTYSQQGYCQECGQGLTQVDAFRIKKAPNWGRRHFLMLNWIEDEFFVDRQAKVLLEKEFSFLSFREVKNKDGTNIHPDMFQLIIPTIPKEGIKEKQQGIREIVKCRHCGQQKFHPSGIGMMQYKREIFDNAPDMVKTAEWFGWGCGASHDIIVSQKMYRFIVDNHLERSLVFSPIELID